MELPPEHEEVFQAKYIPKQSIPEPSQQFDGMSMKAVVSSSPNLGQVTVVSETEVTFIASLEVEASRASTAWEVVIWFSESMKDWKELKLNHVTEDSENRPTDLQHHGGKRKSRRIIYFTSTLSITGPTHFTVKFRAGPDQAWKWVKDNQGVKDGILLPRTPVASMSKSMDLGELIGDLHADTKVEKVQTESPHTSLWSLTTKLPPAEGAKSAKVDIKFGRPWHNNFSRWFALVRIWTPWLCPRQGTDHFAIKEDAVMCSFLDWQGRHLVLLAISGVEDVMTTFASSDSGSVLLKTRNDRPNEGTGRVIVALGDDFESANAAAMYHARKIVSIYEIMTNEEQKEVEAAAEGVQPQWMENWFDGLSYCTWNAFGQDITEDKVIQAVDTLAKNKILITNLIIDDGWQSLHYEGEGQFQYSMTEFEADSKRFPNGLKHVVSRVRETHPNIQHVAVWHALWGYWGAFAPNGSIAKKYKTIKAKREDGERRHLPLGGEMTLVAKEDVQRFYDDFYSFLSSCGIDSVKTDAQFMFDLLGSAEDRADLFTAYLDAWTISSLKHFSIKAISCMSQTPQILFHSQLPTDRPAILVRNSDDFFPEIASSHPWHVWTNAHNALFTQHLNLLPDWDMFQTVHDYSGFHAAARCVSGGPVYITDIPGQHDMNLISQMTGLNPRGKSLIFRPSVVGKALDQYVEYNDEVLLKVGTYHGAAVTGTSIIGLFNISPRPLSELLHLSRFPGTVEAQPYIIRAHNTALISRPLQVADPFSIIDISLEVRGYEIFSAYPLRGFVVKDETIWVATLGLLGKMTGAAAVMSSELTMASKGRIAIETNLKALGVLGIYVSELPRLTVKGNMLITILEEVIPTHCVKVSENSEFLLEVDVERAWNELGLKSQYSNEVGVKVYLDC